MASGYVYILLNASIPGLVKIGKTTRSPKLRVVELSCATGVATPFILVFEKWFSDCDMAEAQTHAILESRGCRVSSGREFFRVEPGDVINLLLEISKEGLQAPKQISDLLTDDLEDARAGPLASNVNAESLLTALLNEARNAQYGSETDIEDPVRALTLYKEAAKAGSLEAYEKIGVMYELGQGIPVNTIKALESFRIGVSKGNYYCWASMAQLFYYEMQVETDSVSKRRLQSNVEKSWSQFLRSRETSYNSRLERSDATFLISLSRLCHHCIDLDSNQTLVKLLKVHHKELLNFVRENMESSRLSLQRSGFDEIASHALSRDIKAESWLTRQSLLA